MICRTRDHVDGELRLMDLGCELRMFWTVMSVSSPLRLTSELALLSLENEISNAVVCILC